jgi:hypothetical protein
MASTTVALAARVLAVCSTFLYFNSSYLRFVHLSALASAWKIVLAKNRLSCLCLCVTLAYRYWKRVTVATFVSGPTGMEEQDEC